MNRGLLFTIAIALAAGGPAQAALVDVTWTGTAGRYSQDALGLFGPAGGDLRGQSLVAHFRYDTSIGCIQSQYSAIDSYESLAACSFASPPSPTLVAQLTINGITVDSHIGYAGGYTRASWNQDPPWLDYSLLETFVYDTQFYQPLDDFLSFNALGVSLNLDNELLPVRLTRSYYRARLPGEVWDLSPWTGFAKYDLTGMPVIGIESGFPRLGATPPSTTVNFVLDSVRVAVPEPASWALMIAGFGVVGGALRQRRRRVVSPI